MQPLSQDTVKRLDLRAAVLAEAASDRNLLIPEPGWPSVAAAADDLTAWLRSELRKGWVPFPQQVVSVRKVRHGVRPLALLSIVDRVIFRALTDALLADEDPLDRSPSAYLRFVRAPAIDGLHAAEKGAAEALTFANLFASPYEYVVLSDITAFYEYVDHAVLGDELLLRGGDYDLVSALLSLLRDIQGRGYGLPQQLQASDRLSEVYVSRVERALLRQGLPVWRFNDDFRIACTDYAEALRAIEVLANAARQHGLVISDHKTVTYGYLNYLFSHLDYTVNADQQVLPPDDLDAAVGDYTDDFGESDAEAAASVLAAAISGAEAPDINLEDVRADQLRLLRRAIGGLATAGSADALPHVKRLATYVPSLMPTLVRYAIHIAKKEQAAVVAALDEVANTVTMNDWQKSWLLYALQESGALKTGSAAEIEQRLVWVSSLKGSAPPTAAAAWHALALVGAATVSELVHALDASPSSLAAWYLDAVQVAYAMKPDKESLKMRQALSNENALYKVLLGAP